MPPPHLMIGHAFTPCGFPERVEPEGNEHLREPHLPSVGATFGRAESLISSIVVLVTDQLEL